MLTWRAGLQCKPRPPLLTGWPVRRVPGVPVPAATRPPGYPAPSPCDLLTGGGGALYKGWALFLTCYGRFDSCR